MQSVEPHPPSQAIISAALAAGLRVERVGASSCDDGSDLGRAVGQSFGSYAPNYVERFEIQFEGRLDSSSPRSQLVGFSVVLYRVLFVWPDPPWSLSTLYGVHRLLAR